MTEGFSGDEARPGHPSAPDYAIMYGRILLEVHQQRGKKSVDFYIARNKEVLYLLFVPPH
jgi:hypothetical protein